MGLVLNIVIAVIVGFVCYMIAQAVPFLAAYATIIGLVIFLLIFAGGYGGWWNFPTRRP